MHKPHLVSGLPLAWFLLRNHLLYSFTGGAALGPYVYRAPAMELLALSASAVRRFEPNRDAVVTFDAIVCPQQWEYVDAEGSDERQC